MSAQGEACSPPVSLLAVLGHPVAHSLSPVMHEAALAAAARPGRYIACPVAPERLEAALAGLAALGFTGCNVTVGLKERACALATRRSPAAAATGAANTLRFDADGGISADTTDGAGLLASLRTEAGWLPTGQRVVLLGAGGAARGIAHAMAASGARVSVHNRTPERARRLAADLGPRVAALDISDLDAVLPEAGLVVNCTTVGMGGQGMPLADASLGRLAPHALVCDIVYAPEDTPFLVCARSLGLRTLGGLGMLAWQAALAWGLWFGADGPVDVMLGAARSELAHRRG